jgi:hypothetical protein
MLRRTTRLSLAVAMAGSGCVNLRREVAAPAALDGAIQDSSDLCEGRIDTEWSHRQRGSCA